VPELPDVELFKRYADATSLHRDVDDVFLRSQLVDDVSPGTIRRHLRGSRLEETRRHGKHLFLRSSNGGWLQLHFGMTGLLESSSGDAPPHTELRLDFADGGHLAFVNQRKFGTISWVDDVDEYVAAGELGPDPLADDVDLPAFLQRLESRRGTIKGALMNQEVIAGLGNVYTDEICFQAGIDPRSATAHLDDGHLRMLHATMRRVIDEAIACHASVEEMPDDWLLPHRESDLPCPRCDGHIERTEVTGRSTYLCAGHQQRIG